MNVTTVIQKIGCGSLQLQYITTCDSCCEILLTCGILIDSPVATTQGVIYDIKKVNSFSHLFWDQ
jgi:hypothetical protein